jgi:hypothetical protein
VELRAKSFGTKVPEDDAGGGESCAANPARAE